MANNAQAQVKQVWTVPTLTVYGSVEELTEGFKNKTWGPADDVLVNNQAILHNLSGQP
jgi:hypothetical protein